MCVFLCCRAGRAVLSPALDEGCYCANIGPWESAGPGQNAGGVVNEIWFECSRSNGNITLEAYSICLHALKIQGFITHSLWCIWENFNVYRCGLSRRRDACINITQPRCCFSPLNSACRMDNRGLICLPRLLSGSTAKQRANCVSVFGGIFSNLKDRGNQCFFHFPSGDVASTMDLWLSEWCH